VVCAKYWLATCASLAVTTGLMLLSCWMLNLPLERTAFFAAAVAAMTFTLNGLAVGLGALYPNLKEDNPGKIVSGFGGTFCLVLSFLYIVCSVSLLAFGSPWSWANSAEPSLAVMIGSWIAFGFLSLLLGWLPLRLGLRNVARFEL